MTELFESTMDNVSELEVKGYSDPVNMERTMEIWAKRGDEEYIYKFTGPGVDKFEAAADGRCWNENKKLKDNYEMLGKAFDKVNKLLKYRDEQLENLKKELHSLKTLKKSNLPETPITDTMLVDDYLKLTKEIEKLTFEKEMLKQENEKLISKNEIELLSKYHDPCDHCVCADVDVSNEPCFSCDHFNKFEKSSFDQPKSDEVKRDEEVEPLTRSDILDQAKKCVCGQREQDYGTPESNFQLIADLWNGYLGFMDHPQDQIRATDVAMMMALLKIARIRNGGGSGDSFVDLAGYAACGGEIWDGERHKGK